MEMEWLGDSDDSDGDDDDDDDGIDDSDDNDTAADGTFTLHCLVFFIVDTTHPGSVHPSRW